MLSLLFFMQNTYAEKWYQLAMPTDEVIAELALASGDMEIIKIKAEKATMVGFMANISTQKMDYFKSINIKPITLTYAVEKLIMYGYGSGQVVLPVSGEIVLEVKNNSNETILVDIFKRS
jgi:hypothetical protein